MSKSRPSSRPFLLHPQGQPLLLGLLHPRARSRQPAPPTASQRHFIPHRQPVGQHRRQPVLPHFQVRVPDRHQQGQPLPLVILATTLAAALANLPFDFLFSN